MVKQQIYTQCIVKYNIFKHLQNKWVPLCKNIMCTMIDMPVNKFMGLFSFKVCNNLHKVTPCGPPTPRNNKKTTHRP